MDEFGNDIVPEIEGDEIQEIEVHGAVRKWHKRDFVDAAILEVKLWDGQMVSESVSANRGNTG